MEDSAIKNQKDKENPRSTSEIILHLLNLQHQFDSSNFGTKDWTEANLEINRQYITDDEYVEIIYSLIRLITLLTSQKKLKEKGWETEYVQQIEINANSLLVSIENFRIAQEVNV
jgi:hypothetical protein